jgi:hypothetical protein
VRAAWSEGGVSDGGGEARALRRPRASASRDTSGPRLRPIERSEPGGETRATRRGDGKGSCTHRRPCVTDVPRSSWLTRARLEVATRIESPTGSKKARGRG